MTRRKCIIGTSTNVKSLEKNGLDVFEEPKKVNIMAI